MVGRSRFHARALLASGRAKESGAKADQLLAELAERGPLATNPDWSGDLAIVLAALGRGAELSQLSAGISTPTSWLRAATAVATGDVERAANTYAEIGSLPNEAFTRLQAAEQLLTAGRRADGTSQLQRALGFYRQVRATAYLRQAEALRAASA